jgi:hypothetical protein
MRKSSPFLITDAAVNQLTLVAAYDPAVIDLVRTWRDAKADLREIETMLADELNYHLNGVSVPAPVS